MIDWIARWKWCWIALILLALAAWRIDRWLFTRDHSQDRHILAAAAHYQVEPALVKAVVWQESRFNPRAQGAKGEIGLMQISEIAAREWADHEKLPNFQHQQLWDPARNTLAGTWYLAKLIKRYPDTDLPYAYALADYNAGRSHVLRWIAGPARTNSQAFLQQMDYPGTRRYIQAILKRYDRYKSRF